MRQGIILLERRYIREPFLEKYQSTASSAAANRMPIRLTCTEPYFVSECLYAPYEDLDNIREVTLHTVTIGSFIENPGKLGELQNQTTPGIIMTLVRRICTIRVALARRI
ncbi:hypothetical protein M0802_003003 [Mischocyttarus mexicanus]|nr:hypothetical protein M0802_003003 [Mischocyttarus mexicanus]